MATMTIEITDAVKDYVDRKVAAGDFKSGNEAVQGLLDAAIRAECRARIEKELLVAMDEIDRGECAPWNPEEDRKLLQELIRERTANGKQ
jgi:Arc/MetJ-type ribon-helix-helix transcriptional regulator